jgi:hypothetical protein
VGLEEENALAGKENAKSLIKERHIVKEGGSSNPPNKQITQKPIKSKQYKLSICI